MLFQVVSIQVLELRRKGATFDFLTVAILIKCELKAKWTKKKLVVTDFLIYAGGVLQMLGKAQLELQKIVDTYVSA